jgi:hypothetical protein
MRKSFIVESNSSLLLEKVWQRCFSDKDVECHVGIVYQLYRASLAFVNEILSMVSYYEVGKMLIRSRRGESGF